MNSESVLRAFSNVASPLFETYLQPNHCIEATRIAIECLKRFQVPARPVPTKFVVGLPALNLVYASGISPEERATAKESICANTSNHTWNGHLVAIVDETWLLDSSFDQAFHTLRESGRVSFEIDPEALIVRLPKLTDTHFHVNLSATLKGGLAAEIQYLSFDDHSFRAAPAWTPDHVQKLIRHICRQMAVQIRAGHI